MMTRNGSLRAARNLAGGGSAASTWGDDLEVRALGPSKSFSGTGTNLVAPVGGDHY